MEDPEGASVVRVAEEAHHLARGRQVGRTLIGIILASLVNLFIASTALQFAVSVIGVLIFAGFTAYDTQQIKEMYYVGDDGSVAGRKAVMGALRLYLDFINLFMLLLQLFGNRR